MKAPVFLDGFTFTGPHASEVPDEHRGRAEASGFSSRAKSIRRVSALLALQSELVFRPLDEWLSAWDWARPHQNVVPGIK